jgi:transposase
MTQFTQTYPTDLQYSEWLLIVQFFPTPTRGRPRKWELWQIMNAILYVTRTGGQWRMLPKDLPPWQTVYGYFWLWTKSGLWATINAALVRHVRQKQERDPQPSFVAILQWNAEGNATGSLQRFLRHCTAKSELIGANGYTAAAWRQQRDHCHQHLSYQKGTRTRPAREIHSRQSRSRRSDEVDRPRPA